MKKIHLKLPALILSLLAVIIIIQGCGASGSSITTEDPDQAFNIAKRKYDKGEYLDAIDDFSFIKVKFPGSSISDKAQFYLASSYYYRKEHLLAAYEFENLQKNYPLSLYIPDSKYMLGLCYYELSPKPPLDQEFTRYAISELSTFIDMYPENKNVTEAQKKLQDLRDKLAYKDFIIAENYMKLDNYRAASLYFQNVYDNYIDSQWADDAMVGNAEALMNGRRYEEAVKLLERFYKLFPKSDQKAKADKIRKNIQL